MNATDGVAELIDGQTVTWMKPRLRNTISISQEHCCYATPVMFNAGGYCQPDGRHWRYDKRYVPRIWELAVFSQWRIISPLQRPPLADLV
ncbi:MAG: hypothetical protein U0694_24060 [Anaerolineae bacterium]